MHIPLVHEFGCVRSLHKYKWNEWVVKDANCDRDNSSLNKLIDCRISDRSAVIFVRFSSQWRWNCHLICSKKTDISFHLVNVLSLQFFSQYCRRCIKIIFPVGSNESSSKINNSKISFNLDKLWKIIERKKPVRIQNRNCILSLFAFHNINNRPYLVCRLYLRIFLWFVCVTASALAATPLFVHVRDIFEYSIYRLYSIYSVSLCCLSLLAFQCNWLTESEWTNKLDDGCGCGCGCSTCMYHVCTMCFDKSVYAKSCECGCAFACIFNEIFLREMEHRWGIACWKWLKPEWEWWL